MEDLSMTEINESVNSINYVRLFKCIELNKKNYK